MEAGMATPAQLEATIKELDWNGLRELWASIQAGTVSGWEKGEAFEYLVLRAFEIDPEEPAVVRYPFNVPLFEENVEEIDGAIHLRGLTCLAESKDLDGNVDIGPISKLRSQLLRRPAGTIGVVFSKRGFTKPARILANFTLPQAILLWTGAEFQLALNEGKITAFLRLKYRKCCETGAPDFVLSER
jgi:hypothetical protein